MRGHHAVGDQPLPVRGIADPICHEPGQCRLVAVLQLAAAASTEMAAWRIYVVWSAQDTTIGGDAIPRRGPRYVAAARGHAIAPCGDADNLLPVVHRQAATAPGIASASCPAVNGAGHSRAASP